MTDADVVPLRWRPQLDAGTRWRLVRKEYGRRIGEPTLTQVRFAEAIDVNPNTYKQWEAGNNVPEDVVAMARHAHSRIGVDPAFLLGIADITDTPLPPNGGAQSRCTAHPQVRHHKRLSLVSSAA